MTLVQVHSIPYSQKWQLAKSYLSNPKTVVLYYTFNYPFYANYVCFSSVKKKVLKTIANILWSSVTIRSQNTYDVYTLMRVNSDG